MSDTTRDDLAHARENALLLVSELVEVTDALRAVARGQADAIDWELVRENFGYAVELTFRVRFDTDLLLRHGQPVPRLVSST